MEEEEKKKNCFLMFYDWEPLLNMLTEEEAGGLLFALYAYEIREETPREGALSPSATSLFIYLSKLLDDSKKSWYDKRKAGAKGGKKSADLKQTSSNIQADLKQKSSRPQAEVKQTSSNTQAEVKQNQPKEKEKEKEKEKVSPNGDIERDKRETGKPSRVCFVPPTVEEVRAYCQERQNNIDPESFVAFYNSNGWLVGKNKMKNWKSAVITWEKRQGRIHGDAVTKVQDSVTDWDKIAKEVEQLGYFDNGNNHANVFAGIPATVREDVGG